MNGGWYDNRHTLVTELAESGAGDEVITSIAGHVSRQMLAGYSHIRMEVKRAALEGIVSKPEAALQATGEREHSDAPVQRVQ